MYSIKFVNGIMYIPSGSIKCVEELCSMQLRRCVGGDASYFEGCDFDFLFCSYRSSLFLRYDTSYLCMDFHQIRTQRATRVKSSPRNTFVRAQRVFTFILRR